MVHPPSNITETGSKLDKNMTIQDGAFAVINPTPLLITKLMDSIKSYVTTEVGVKKAEAVVTLPLCDSMPPDLGR